MAERINEFVKQYIDGRIAMVISRDGRGNLTAGQICLKIPDIRIDEIMAWAGACIDPIGSNDPKTDAFKSLQRLTAQSWIDYAYNEAPEIAERLDRELNPDEV